MTEKQIFDYLVGAGFTPQGAAGLMGNLKAESGLNPRNVENSKEKKLGMTDDEYTAAVDSGRYQNFIHDGAGYGLAQWTFHTRKKNLLDVARANGKSIGDAEMQMAFLMTELSAYGELWAVLQTTADTDKAADLVLTRFERPADIGESVKKTRRAYAKEILQKCSEKGNVNHETTATSGGDSPLVTVTDWTTKHSGKRKQPISKITIHHMAGVMSAADCMRYHRQKAGKVSANYYIGKDGEIGQAVHEKDRAWTSSSEWNDTRAVTIEVSNKEAKEPWGISSTVYKSLIALCVDICKRNGIQSVRYTGDKDGSLTEHRMFSNTACPGDSIHSLLKDKIIEGDINLGLCGKEASQDEKAAGKQMTVRVRISDLNIRQGAGTDYGKAGICPPGTYTITETRSGKGSKGGWGRLKSGAGWISLDFTEKA